MAKALQAPPFSAHPSEDALESYVMGRLPLADQASFEEHILICNACLERLEETVTYVESFKCALDDAASGE